MLLPFSKKLNNFIETHFEIKTSGFVFLCRTFFFAEEILILAVVIPNMPKLPFLQGSTFSLNDLRNIPTLQMRQLKQYLQRTVAKNHNFPYLFWKLFSE